MKRIKEICGSFIVMIACVLFLGTNVNAADNLYFDDPTTQVGAELTVRVFLSTESQVTSSTGTLSFDPAYLEFISGDNATLAENGKISISTAEGADKVEYHVTFRPLQVGTTKITTDSYEAQSASGTLNPALGDSTVTIEAGANGETSIEASGDASTMNSGDLPTVDVNGVTYQISENFTDAEIPDGFTAQDMNYDGVTIKAVTQEASGQSLIYLTSADGTGSFFVYNSDNGTVGPFEQIYVTNDFYIILLNEPDKVKLPSNYEETTLTIDNNTFPAWQNVNNPDFYAMYALSSQGNKDIYSYDMVEETYQRLNTVADTQEEKTEAKSAGFLGKVTDFLKSHIELALILIAALFLLLLIILIVVGTKLRHRNLELDDLYDEYGIDEDEEVKEQPKKQPKKSKKPKKAEDELEELNFDEDEFEDDDFDDGDDFEDEDDFEDDFDDDSFDDIDDLDDNFDEGFDEDDDDMGVINLDDTDSFDSLDSIDEDEDEEEKPSRKPGGKSVRKPLIDNDTDFIDLD